MWPRNNQVRFSKPFSFLSKHYCLFSICLIDLLAASVFAPNREDKTMLEVFSSHLRASVATHNSNMCFLFIHRERARCPKAFQSITVHIISLALQAWETCKCSTQHLTARCLHTSLLHNKCMRRNRRHRIFCI